MSPAHGSDPDPGTIKVTTHSAKPGQRGAEQKCHHVADTTISSSSQSRVTALDSGRLPYWQ
jgi:hypothetical protein